MQPLAAFALGMLALGAAHAQTTEPSPEDEYGAWPDPAAEVARPDADEPTPDANAAANPHEESELGSVFGAPPSVPPPPLIERPPPLREAPRYGPARADPAPVSHEANHVSIYGAPTLGTLNRAIGFSLGFPLAGVRAAVGAAPRWDVGIGFDSLYGLMNDFRLVGKYVLRGDRAWAVAVAMEAGTAFFAQRPDAEAHGPRWLTGRRNYNVEVGLITSHQGSSPQSSRLFFDVRYHLGIDTQPYAQDPLGGVPPPVQLGHNIPIRIGAEMPFSPRAAFLFVFGFEIHGRASDSRFMPLLAVGLVTGI